jgi:glycerophosphoryl diester phosphodiesterase
MSSLQECTGDREKKCIKEKDKGHNECTESRDDGYNECTESRDEGYSECCDWSPCDWFCDAWVWISNIVCIVWTWISNIVCVVWTWIKNIVCVVWVYASAAICMIPGIGKSITDFLDGVLDVVMDLLGLFYKGILWLVGTVVGTIVYVITHPVQFVETIISLFGGCPSDRADIKAPLLIIGHHGSPPELPENTIQSCARAIFLGANALEVDICMTSDEQLILWHDWSPDYPSSLGRQLELQPGYAFKAHVPKLGSDWRRPTIELTLEEFREHYSYEDMRDGLAKARWNVDHGPVDLTIPTLSDFLVGTRDWPELRVLYLDIKMPGSAAGQYATAMTDHIHALLANRRGAEFKVVLMVPDSSVLTAMKNRSAEMGYGMAFTWDVEFPVGLILNPIRYSAINHATTSLFHNSVASVGKPVLAPFIWRLYRRTVAYDIDRWNEVNADPGPQNSGIKIDSLVTWTIDDKDEMNCLSRMGVTGIITNKISDLVAVAATTGR